MKAKHIAVSLLFVYLLIEECFALQLRAGASVRKITPAMSEGRPVYLAGYGYNRVASGVHDDLYARCLALSDGKTTVAFVSLDLIGFFYSEVAKVREELQTRAPRVTNVIISSTHTHEGPDALGLWGESPFKSGLDEAYVAFVRKQIVEAVVEATKAMEAAQVRFARDDRPELASLIEDSRLPIVKDWAVLGMKVESADGKRTIATVVNWACHAGAAPVDSPEGHLISADFPGYLCQRIEKRYGGVALFWAGAIGGQQEPSHKKLALRETRTDLTEPQESYRRVQFLGYRVGEIIMEALDKVPQGKVAIIPQLKVKTTVLFVPMLNERFRLAASFGIVKRSLYTNGKVDTSTVEQTLPGIGTLEVLQGKDVQTEISVIQMGNAQLITVPGELYPELAGGSITRYAGADFPDAPFEPPLREHMRSQYKFLIGLGNDELGYIIPKAEWDAKAPWLDNADDETYGEINSVGYETAPVLAKAIVELLKEVHAGSKD